MKRLFFVHLSKISIVFFIAFLGTFIVPYKGFFPYADELLTYHLPRYFTAFANFDGLHYIAIARDGYHQYEQAFFPLYPLMMRLLSFFFNRNYLISGLVISYCSFIGGSIVLYALIKSEMREYSFWWVFAFLLSFPTAFFFSAIYTESFFFLVTVASFYFIKKQHFFRAGICTILASATRFVGVFLFLPFLLIIFKQKKPAKKSFLFALFPFVGLAGYMTYLYMTTKDPLSFINAQPVFGANRSDHLIFLPQVYYRYMKIFFFSQHTFQYFIALLEFIFFTVIFILCIIDFKISICKRTHFYTSLVLFSLVNILLPASTGTFSSIPRYGLLSLSIYFYLARIKSVKIKSAIIGLFCIGQIVLLALFVQGYFIA